MRPRPNAGGDLRCSDHVHQDSIAVGLGHSLCRGCLHDPICLALPITLAAALEVTHLGFAGEPGSANDPFHLAMYADAAGEPGALLASVEFVTMVSGANDYALASPVSVASGARIWLTLCNEARLELSIIEGQYAEVRLDFDAPFANGTPDPLLPEPG